VRHIDSIGASVRVMDQLIEVYGKPEAVRPDNGPEPTADKFTDWAKEHGINLLFIQPGKPNQNAFFERFNRSFREEVLNAWLFNAVSEAQAAADEWMVDYNECRPHESLGNVPPVVFRPRVFNAEVSTSELSTRRGVLRLDLLDLAGLHRLLDRVFEFLALLRSKARRLTEDDGRRLAVLVD
jgi:putative transposase